MISAVRRSRMTYTRHKSWPSHFEQWGDAVQAAVETYETHVRKTFPQREALIAQRRRRWVMPYGPIPYYLPYWLADAFPVVDRQKVRSAGEANVFLYHYY